MCRIKKESIDLFAGVDIIKSRKVFSVALKSSDGEIRSGYLRAENLDKIIESFGTGEKVKLYKQGDDPGRIIK